MLAHHQLKISKKLPNKLNRCIQVFVTGIFSMRTYSEWTSFFLIFTAQLVLLYITNPESQNKT